MKEIKLTKGKVALVDDEDFECVNQFCWQITGRYARRSIWINPNKSKTVMMHRFIMGCPVGLEVDHINGEGLDNRKENLRICTPSDNKRNIRGKRKFKGVYLRIDKKFYAQISVDGKMIHIGTYETEIMAAKAYDDAAKKYNGKFANLNLNE